MIKGTNQTSENCAAVAPQSATEGPSQEPQKNPIAETVAEVIELEDRGGVTMTLSDRLADLITAFAGSMLFVWLHVIWFGVWIFLNLDFLGLGFDEFPFGFLTMIVSLEAIFLSTFVLISQNRQALQADRRSKVDLQVNVISEREITKLIELVADIHQHLNGGQHLHDPSIEKMLEKTKVSKLADAVDGAEAQEDGADRSDRPENAADTEA